MIKYEVSIKKSSDGDGYSIFLKRSYEGHGHGMPLGTLPSIDQASAVGAFVQQALHECAVEASERAFNKAIQTIKEQS